MKSSSMSVASAMCQYNFKHIADTFPASSCPSSSPSPSPRPRHLHTAPLSPASALVTQVATLVFLGILLTSPIAQGQTAALDGDHAQEVKIIFSSGPPGGEYFRMATAIANELNGRGFHIEVVPSTGSIENLQAIDRELADLAIVQSNVLSRTETAALPLMSLTNEAVHLITGSVLDLPSLAYASDKRVFLGSPGSGSRATALYLLGRSGISSHQVTEVAATSYKDLIELIQRDQVDIAFLTMAYPNALLKDAFANSELRLVALNESFIKQLVLDNDDYLVTRLPAGIYGLGYPVPTVAVRAVLVTSPKLSDPTAHSIVQAVYAEWESISERLGYHERVGYRGALCGISTPLHPGADRFFDDHKHHAWIPRFSYGWVIPLLIFVGALYVLRYNKRQLHWLLRNHIPLTVSVFLGAWILGAALMYLLERHVNEDFDPLWEAFWSIAVHLFSGFEDRYPVTEAGRVVTLLVMLVGAACLAVLTASIAALFTYRRMKGDSMPKRMQGHFVVCNCDERIFTLIRHLYSRSPDDHVPIVVLSTRKDIRLHGRKDDNFLEDVFRVHGDPTSQEMLKRVNAQDAKCVIVLASSQHAMIASEQQGTNQSTLDTTSVDARTIMTLLSLRKIFRQEKGGVKYVPAVVELFDPQNKEMAYGIGTISKSGNGSTQPTVDGEELAASAANQRNEGEDFGLFGANRWVQVVCGSEIRTLLLAQAAHTPGIARLFRRLLTYSEDTNEFYIQELPEQLNNLHFRDAIMWITSFSIGENPAIPIGIQSISDGKLTINPKSTLLLKKSEHKLVLIAYKEPLLEGLSVTEMEVIKEGVQRITGHQS